MEEYIYGMWRARVRAQLQQQHVLRSRRKREFPIHLNNTHDEAS